MGVQPLDRQWGGQRGLGAFSRHIDALGNASANELVIDDERDSSGEPPNARQGGTGCSLLRNE